MSALTVKLLVGGSLIMAMVTVPLMANTVLAQTPLEGGLRLMRMTGAMPIGALVGGYLAYRLGERSITIGGLVLGSLGLFLMSGWTLDIADPRMTLHLALAGLGFGLIIAPVFITAMDATTADYQATSASLVTAARMVGMTFGMAALAAWGVGEFQAATQGLALPLPSQELSNAEYAAQLGRVHGRGVRREPRPVPGLLPHLRRAAAVGAAARARPRRSTYYCRTPGLRFRSSTASPGSMPHSAATPSFTSMAYSAGAADV